MLHPSQLRLTVLVSGVLCLVAVSDGSARQSEAEAVKSAPRARRIDRSFLAEVTLTPDSMFLALEKAWAREDADALQGMLAAGDIRLQLLAADEEPADQKTFSRAQVFYMLRELFDEIEVTSSTLRRWALSEDGTTAHGLLETEWTAGEGEDPQRRRLFVRMRLMDEGWRAFEVRALP